MKKSVLVIVSLLISVAAQAQRIDRPFPIDRPARPACTGEAAAKKLAAIDAKIEELNAFIERSYGAKCAFDKVSMLGNMVSQCEAADGAKLKISAAILAACGADTAKLAKYSVKFE